MKNCIKLLILLFLLNSCKKETKETLKEAVVKTEKVGEEETLPTVYKDYSTAPVDFLDEKFKVNGFEFQDNSPTYPSYNFFDKNLGGFSVNSIGKSAKTRDYWDYTNDLDGFFVQFKGMQIDNDDQTTINNRAEKILKRDVNNHFIIANFLPIEATLPCSGCEPEEFELKKDAYTYFYIYENKKWIFIKRLLTKGIEKQGVSLFTDIVLSHKLKDLQPITEKFRGKFKAEVDGEYTTDGRGHTTYYFTITENKVDLKSEEFRGDFVCQGEYKAIENDSILELYYDREDSRCLRLEPTYSIKNVDGVFFIKGIGGEATYHDWIQMEEGF